MLFSPASPLIGRSSDISALLDALTAAEGGRGGTVLLAGEGGIGKTRLVETVVEEATRRGCAVAVGHAYPLETGVPYGLIADALVPLLRQLDSATLNVLARGGQQELTHLFPSLGEARRGHESGLREDAAELKSRALWNLTQLLQRYAAQRTLLIALENLHWADASSLELLHLLARQVTGSRILLLGTYNDAERDLSPALRAAEQSLTSQGIATMHRLRPLTREQTDELVNRSFGVEGVATREFTALLYGWTRGNPFFIEETLKALIASGRLQQQGDVWIGWDVSELELPGSIREAVIGRVARLSPRARAVADLLATSASETSYSALRAMMDTPETELLSALDELRQQRITSERLQGDEVLYYFTHPILRETLYAELGLARARVLHAAVAEALERLYGERADQNANELAFHFARAGGARHGDKAIRYLAAAGTAALERHANREAANYLSAALDRVDRGMMQGAPPPRLLEQLARARTRLGEYAEARALYQRARGEAEQNNDLARVAAIERRLGLASYWSGRHEDALRHFDAGLAAAEKAASDQLITRLRIAKGACLQELGRADDARAELEQALAVAEQLQGAQLLARVHRALLLLYIWTGPKEAARRHGERAIELAEATGAKSAAGMTHWAMAMMGGVSGDPRMLQHHLAACERIAEELRSPVLRVHAYELAIEFASHTGDWDTGIALGERAIQLARALHQPMVLTRLLVWTALMYIGRDELERARRMIDEAWELSGAGRERAGDRPLEVHTVVPAHIGRATWHLVQGEVDDAIRVAEAGLAIAERTGYVAWAIYRLWPVLGEAYLRRYDHANTQRVGERLREASARHGHLLGLAWAQACDALVTWRSQDAAAAIEPMRNAIEALERIPHVTDAARLRRQLAGRLADVGEREAAVQELRRVHDFFARMGAERELRSTREMLRQIGARPPARAAAGAEALTSREAEIVRQVVANKSNKAVGKSLGISPRTVSTHLANIFRKLNVASREELLELIREEGLP